MIIDLILDRKDGYNYNVEKFYKDVVSYGEVGFDIARALDSGTEKDVKNALCDYIINNDYNKNICKYINSVNWLDGFVENKKSDKKSIKESNMILSFEAFKDICIDYIGSKMYIGSFDEYEGTYFISVIGDTRADKLCKYLRKNYDCECTFWKITDPYEDDYGFYRVEVI